MPKLKKFCKITRYIEQIDGELAQMITDLCLDRLFIPRGVNGITFLYPKEPSYRKEIISSAYSDSPEKAIQMLESLIVLDYLPRPGDFVLKKDDIPNSLRQRIEVTSADASSVKLSCGSVLKPDPGFSAINTRENMAVYHLTGKQVPLNGPKASMKYASKRHNNKPKTGGSMHEEALGGKTMSPRLFWRHIITLVNNGIDQDGNLRKLVEILVTRLNLLMKEDKEYLAQIAHNGQLDRNPLAFLVKSDLLNVPSSSVHHIKWVETYGGMGFKPITKDSDLLAEYQNLITAAYGLTSKHDAKEPHGTDKQREELQAELMNYGARPELVSKIEAAYSKFYDGVSNPVQSRMRLDDIGFIANLLTFNVIHDNPFQPGVTGGKDEARELKNTFQEIVDMYEQTAGATTSNQLIALNGKNFKSAMDPAKKLTVEMFVKSDGLMGGNRSGKNPGETNPSAVADPAGNDGTVNIGSIMGGFFSGGMKSHMTASSLQQFL
jgi:hypothetical protein